MATDRLDPTKWPAFAFHPDKPGVQVATPAAFDALGPGWSLDPDVHKAYVGGQQAADEPEPVDPPVKPKATKKAK